MSSSSSDSGNNSPPKLKKRNLAHYERFKISPQKRFKATIINYPGNLPFPFPLPKEFINYLRTTKRSVFAKNSSMYASVIRTIYSLILEHLGKKPTKNERDIISEGLCCEYPLLGCGERTSRLHSALSNSLRKRANSYHIGIKNLLSDTETDNSLSDDDVENKTQEDSSIELVHENIKSFTGSNRAKMTIQTYPHYKDSIYVSGCQLVCYAVSNM